MKTKKPNMNRTYFDYIGEKWIIARTNHLYDVRDSATGDYSRDEFLDNQRYIDIFKCAIRNGLTSFRCKGPIVVTIPADDNVFYAILCRLEKNNKIVIISVFRKKQLWWKCYIKERSRITVLNDYKIPRMNKQDIQNKQITKIQHQITMSKEDKQFKNVMNHIKDLVRFQ